MKLVLNILFILMYRNIHGQYLGGTGNGEKIIFAGNITIGEPSNDGLYRGGTSSGETTIGLNNIRLERCNDQKLVWNGNASIFWSIARNWDCGTIPTPNSIVSITSGMTRYPIILSNIKIKQLWLHPSASLIITPIGRLVVENP